ncbi:GumC family protein [Spirosoma telluris]|uniref:GumC family protein n=1 Tax=Spirosoma telluris TaxID=2183553 RepID=UPI002FC3A390
MSDSNNEFWEEKETPFNLRLFFVKYLRYWYWFVLSIAICLATAYIYLRYSTPIYQVSSTLLIKDQNSSTNDILKELETSTTANKNVENEIEVLKSRSLMQRVVDDLNLTVAYFQQGQVRSDEEIYGTSPIRFQPILLTPLAYQGIFVKLLNRQQFELEDEEGNHRGKFNFGQPVKNEYGTFRVFLNDSLYRKNNDLIKVAIDDQESVAERYKSLIQVQLLNPKSTVLKLTIEDAVPAKGKAILNSLLAEYNYSTLRDKNREATNTLQFIDERLRLITGELGNVERDVEAYKSSRGITDLSEEATLYLGKVNENDAKLNELDIQAKVLEGVENYLKSSQTGVAPATLMVNDPILLTLLTKLNELEAQQGKYERSTQPDSPFLQTINAQIASTKSSIRENITNQKNNLEVTRASLKGQNSRFASSIRTIPQKEREFITIKRQQGIKESLYLLLLQKRKKRLFHMRLP